MDQPSKRTVLVASNCAKTQAAADAIDAKQTLYDEIPTGVCYLIDEDTNLIIRTAVQAAACNTFKYVGRVGTELLVHNGLIKSGIRASRGDKAQYFLSDRVLIGDMTGITSAAKPETEVTAGTHYSLDVKLNMITPYNFDPLFTATAQFNTVAALKGRVYTQLAAQIMDYKNARDFISVIAHSDAADLVAGVSVSIRHNSKFGSITAGTLLAGDHIAYTGTVVADARVQPRGVYKVKSVSGTNFELVSTWQAESITATAIETIALDDADEWGLMIFTKRYFLQYGATPGFVTPKFDVMVSGFNPNEDVVYDGTLMNGQMEAGFSSQVLMDQHNTWSKDPNLSYEAVVNGLYYSNISMSVNQQTSSRDSKRSVLSFVNTYLQAETEAELIAGTNPTYLTNIISGTGVEDTVEGSIVNSINLLIASLDDAKLPPLVLNTDY